MVGFLEKYCNNSWSRIVELLESDIKNGIKDARVPILKRKYGSNKIEIHNNKKIYKYIFDEIIQKYTLLFIIISIVLFSFTSYIYVFICTAILLINIFLSIFYHVI
ncbi:MAG TPA: hypothetical protein DG753_09210 [Clostridium sp.]|nr:hypothetical protein [Clostridium sp.]